MAKAIAGRRGEIIRRWTDRVAADAARRGHSVAPTGLRQGITDYLTRLTEVLAPERERNGNGDGEAHGDPPATAAWREIARQHGLTRVRSGFDVRQLVRELVLLREVIVETLAADTFPLDGAQASRIAGVIDAAIAAVVHAYVESRDHAAETYHAQQVGFITQELRNPLTTAKIAVAQLRSQVQAAPGTARLLDALERSVERLQRLVQDVLLSERLGSGELRSNPVDVTLGAIMDDALRVPVRDAQAKRIHIETRFDPDLLLHVDPTLAVSAVQNVVENAVRYTTEGSVQIEGEDRGGEAAIHVRDMCSGLSAEELETIFEPFRRGHAGRAQGTGIGLAIARRAALAMGGEIAADSSESVGCHFCLTLPKSRH